MRVLRGVHVQEFSFGLVVSGVDFADDEVVNRFYGAGIDDASFGVRSGCSIAHFDREASTYFEAFQSAIRDLEGAVAGAKVSGIQSDDLLSPSGVADVSGRTRQNIHQHIQGARGEGFPTPIAWADGDRPLWLRSDVRSWMRSGETSGDLSWAGVADSVFLFVRACAARPERDLAPGLAFVMDRYLALCAPDEAQRKQLGEELRELASHVEQG